MNDDVPTLPVVTLLLRASNRVGPYRRLATRSLGLSGWLWCVLFAGQARGEDTVHLASRTGDDAQSRLVGTVIDFTGAGLRIRLAGGVERDYPPERVIRIETNRSADQLAGDRLYAEQKFSEALAQYRAAYGKEQRSWVKREILAAAVRCYTALGNPRLAGETFLEIASVDPQTPHFAVIPLAWYPAEPSERLRQSAEEWLKRREQPAAVLLGASHLLATNRRNAALAQLHRLTTIDDVAVAWLATTQVWRATAAETDAQEVLTWPTKLEKMPVSLRAGPYYVAGTALANRDQGENAVLALLRVPILYPDERDLAARALLGASEVLEKMDRPNDAAQLYRELSTSYPETRAAAEAAGRREQP